MTRGTRERGLERWLKTYLNLLELKREKATELLDIASFAEAIDSKEAEEMKKEKEVRGKAAMAEEMERIMLAAQAAKKKKELGASSPTDLGDSITRLDNGENPTRENY